MRPKVALVTSGLGTRYGGIGMVAQMMVSAVERDAEVLVWEHPPFWPRPLRIATVAWRMIRGSLKHPDLVIYDHVHLAVLHALTPALRKTPYIVFLHGGEVWVPLPAPRREALLRADLLLTNSATTEAEARSFNPWLPKVSVTWLGVRHQPHPADVSLSPPTALMVGRMLEIERHKGHDAVLNAWPLIRSAVPAAKLMIVGRGDDETRLRQRVKNEGLDGIQFCGWLSDAQRDQMYRSCRLLFFPSKEGFGLAGVEAASFAVPFLAVAGTVAEELFPPGTGVVFAKGKDPGGIAQAAIPLLADPQCAARLGRAARARVQAVFLEENFMERFREAICPFFGNRPIRDPQA